ncbi:MAG: ATP-binding cassette domain-containing protein [Spirochaetaceae bacterium]|jgi:putative ABC transport system ATP-binding protein|nr:ATP-binding cassette domain-containing protein [Spirochaetaceae bacterium]
MIKIENLSMVFSQGTPDENLALKNINLTVTRGDFVTIIGSNGAGKTTLYNTLSGTFKPTQGKIFIHDNKGILRDVTRDPEYRRARYIGRIFQNPLLGTAGNMALEDNMLICHKKGYKGLKISLNNKLREEFRTALRQLDMGLENRMRDNVGLLSGGQRQALTLLMTVMSHPSILLLDEHTAALDPRNAEIVMNLTLKFAKEYNLTVMMITHNMAHAIKFGNRLLMMDGGEIILDIDSEEKQKMTTADIVQRFREIKKQDLANDELLLS